QNLAEGRAFVRRDGQASLSFWLSRSGGVYWWRDLQVAAVIEAVPLVVQIVKQPHLLARDLVVDKAFQFTLTCRVDCHLRPGVWRPAVTDLDLILYPGVVVICRPIDDVQPLRRVRGACG